MIKLDYPAHHFKIEQRNNKECIFDPVRKKWVRLTPEEWVRQNLLQYLIQVKKIPQSLIAVEKEIQLHELCKRCDIVVYKNNIPWMIAECKELNMPLTEAVLEQVLRYNLAISAEYLVISNGSFCFAWQRAGGTLQAINQLPGWAE